MFDSILTLTLAFAITVFTWPSLVLANHYICSWRPWKDNPQFHGMVTFCQAKKSMSLPVVNWTCGENYIGKVGTLVADWNVLRDDVLEMATPCAGGGYGWDDQGDCCSDTWAMCLGPPSDANCYYQDHKDDCEWPTKFSFDNLPAEINVLFHRGF